MQFTNKKSTFHYLNTEIARVLNAYSLLNS